MHLQRLGFGLCCALFLLGTSASARARGPASSDPAMAAVKAAYDSGDYAGAARLLRHAAEQGDPRAECGLGILYEHGRGVSKDLGQALAWYRKAAAAHDPRAENNLGWLYAHGKGVPRDDTQALAWFKAALGDSRDDWFKAMVLTNLGNTRLFGKGAARDYPAAAAAYRRAAELGNAEAQNKMGWLCERGLGTTRDLKAAAQWYSKAASQGFSLGQGNLAYLYETGQGVLLSYPKAFKLYSTAAVAGNHYAASQLGGLYEHGLGAPRDLVQACRWYLDAARAGDEDAKEDAERLRLVLKPEQWAEAQRLCGPPAGAPSGGGRE